MNALPTSDDLYCVTCPIADDRYLPKIDRRAEDVALYAATVACDEADHALLRALAIRDAHGQATAGRMLRDMTADDFARDRQMDADVLAAYEAVRRANAVHGVASKALGRAIGW